MWSGEHYVDENKASLLTPRSQLTASSAVPVPAGSVAALSSMFFCLATSGVSFSISWSEICIIFCLPMWLSLCQDMEVIQYREGFTSKACGSLCLKA